MNLFFHPFQSSAKSMLRSHQERLEASRRLEQGEEHLISFDNKTHSRFSSFLGKLGLHTLHDKIHVRLTNSVNIANASEVARSQVKVNLYTLFQDDQASHPNCHPKLARIMEQLKQWAAYDVNGISSELKQRWEQDALNRAKTLLAEADSYWNELTDTERELVTGYRVKMDSIWNGGLDTRQINRELQQPEDNNIVHRANVKQGEEYTKWDGDNIAYQVRDCSKTRFGGIRTSFSAADQPLFPHEPCVGDVNQGALGDCYLMSALASLVSQNPNVIREAMHDEGETVTVRFFVPQVPAGTTVGGRAYRSARRYPLYVRVPKKTPGLIPGALGPLWVKMMERAYAASMLHLRLFADDVVRDIDQLEETRPAYNQIEGGRSSNFLSLLTEHPITTELTLVNGRKKELNHNLNGNISVDIAFGIPGDLLRDQQPEGEAQEPMEAHNSQEVPQDDQAALDRQALRKAHIIVTHRASLLGLPAPTFDTPALAEAYTNSAELLMKAMTEVMDDYSKSQMILKKNWFGTKEKTVNHLSSLEELTDYMLDQGGMKKAALMASIQASDPVFQSTSPDQIQAEPSTFMDQLVHDMSSKEAMQRFLQRMTKDETLHHEPFSGAYSEKALNVFNTIQAAIHQGAVVTTDIHDFVYGGQFRRKVRGLWDNHAYSVTGTVEKGGLRFVVLRNPWGMIGRRSTFKKDIQRSSHWIDLHNDGYFLMELNDYVTNYENTQIVHFNTRY